MACRYIGTENQLMIHILEGEEAAPYCRWNIETLMDLIAANAHIMLKKGNYTRNEAIDVSQVIIKIFQLFMNKNYGFYHCRLAKCYFQLGKLQAQVGCNDRQSQSKQLIEMLKTDDCLAKVYERLR